jgi:hypothetical protein
MTSTLQRDLRAGQGRLDLVIKSRIPLVPLDVVKVILDRDEDDVLHLINDRLLLYAFDIRSRDAERSFPLVAVESIDAYAAGDFKKLTAGRFATTPLEQRTLDAECRRVIETFLPHRKPVLRTPEIARIFGHRSKQHIHDLLEEQLLVATKAATVNTSAEITRTSFINFLLSRRMPLLKGPKP